MEPAALTRSAGWESGAVRLAARHGGPLRSAVPNPLGSVQARSAARVAQRQTHASRDRACAQIPNDPQMRFAEAGLVAREHLVAEERE
jgi:hypothetical protein